MTSSARFTFLGTGSSGGVPRVGNDWGVCDPTEPKNRRRRCCALIDVGKPDQPDHCTRLLIDSSPDLREQLLDVGLKHLDALVYTHDHADQSHGIDDVRAIAIAMRRTIPTYMDAATAASLTNRFEYCFKGRGGYPAILDLQPFIEPGHHFTIRGKGPDISLLPLDQEHGRIRSLGFRIGNLAYCNDVSGLPPETVKRLAGVDILILDALRYTIHPSHAHLEQSLRWIAELKPARSYLTNLHVDMDYATLCNELPENIRPAYDGLSIDFKC